MVNRLEQAMQAQRAGRHEEAVSLLTKFNAKKKSRTARSVMIESRSSLALGDWQAAADLLRRGLGDRTTREETLELSQALAGALAFGKKFPEAIRSLKNAEKAVPREKLGELRLQQALIYSQDYRYSRALKRCLPLLEDDRYSLRAALLLMELAVQLSDLELFDQALDVLERELSSLNDVNLLALVERVIRYRPQRSDVIMNETRRRRVMPNRVALFEARRLFDQGDYAAARTSLEEVADRRLDATLKPLYWNIQASLQEKEQAYREAFVSYRRMNEASAAMLPVDWQKTGFDPVRPFKAFHPDRDGFESPVPLVFIVGFPRSGTTLLEVILDSQPGVSVVDEKPIIHNLKSRLVDDGYNLDNCLEQLEQDYLLQLREQYLSHAAEYVREPLEDIRLLVDKNPLQVIDLPLINVLFPGAKVLMVIRHPLDVILSCYQQTFEVNSQMPFFAEWTTCFTHYHHVMEAVEENRLKLSLDVCNVHYEKLVDSFDDEVQRILGFLGMSPDVQAYRQFDRRAENRIVNTPSSGQVKKGLYSGSTYRWKNYRNEIEEHLHIVQKHIQRLGYEV